MNQRWYFFVALISIALFGGIANQYHNVEPNQAIVLQFDEVESDSESFHDAINVVKGHLQKLGAENISVSTLSNGNLQITYHSEDNVTSIKRILGKERSLSFHFNSEEGGQEQIPSEENPISYNLDIYEIQNNVDLDSNLGGKKALEFKAERSRYIIDVKLASISNITPISLNKNIKVAYHYQRNIALAIDHISKKIPEVRAGPYTVGQYV